jgi:cell division protein FtsI/penicillin-binding protein 2
MRALLAACALGFVTMGAAPVEACQTGHPSRQPSFLIVDVSTGQVVASRWIDPDCPLPVGSLIKPFVAIAYAEAHGRAYPTITCRGSADGCWFPAGHGRLGITDAVAVSCNVYFRRLAENILPGRLRDTLTWLGMSAEGPGVTPSAMIGLGDALRLPPMAIVHGYRELVSRATHPGVAQVLAGMREAGRYGTGRALGAAMGHTDVLTKTGTAPCVHSPRAPGDGYTVAVYPAARPRVILLVQAHGKTGADTARDAGVLLREMVEVR